jgi:hypothetical protein
MMSLPRADILCNPLLAVIEDSRYKRLEGLEDLAKAVVDARV